MFIREKLESVLASAYPRELFDILVVSDESDDTTDSIVAAFAPRGVRFLRVPRGGKSAALNAGIPLLTGEILLLTDVRQRLDPDCMQHLVNGFADPEVGVVSGDLVIRDGDTMGEKNTGLYWRYESWIRKNLSAVDSVLGATGPIYAIRRELALPLPPETILDDVYLPLSAIFAGFRSILEERAKAYDYPTGLQSEFRRKVRTLAGMYQLLVLRPKVLWPGNRIWLPFVSVKLGRLFMPFAFMAIGVASVFLPFYWAAAAVLLQVVFYGIGIVDPYIPPSFPGKRLTSSIRAFLVLILAALCGLSYFFISPQDLWKETKVNKAPAWPVTSDRLSGS
jgi:cellulose synthase/poly-beta-1,6-N-acetylglucosamine synthase-like glycosyltransferase